jgi:hypothetical protein
MASVYGKPYIAVFTALFAYKLYRHSTELTAGKEQVDPIYKLK